MDAADLRIFAAVARTGAMNRAAGELHTVQSNVTARVRLLEEELGAALFERHSRGVTLTAAGRRLLPYAARIGDLMKEARLAVADEGVPQGPLALGSLETTAAVRLPPILAAYARSYPAVDLTLATGTTAELIAEVLARRCDGAFVCGPVDHPDLAEEIIFEEELAIVTQRPLQSLGALGKAADLKIVVLRAGCSYRQRLETLLARRGIVGLRRLEFGTLEGLMGCVAAGLGITLLPKSLVLPAVAASRVALHDLPPAEAKVETAFIRRRDSFLSSALTAFLACARPRKPRVEAAE